jgi:hypothetical protein
LEDKCFGKFGIKVSFKIRMGEGGLYLSGLEWEEVAAFVQTVKSIGMCRLCRTS